MGQPIIKLDHITKLYDETIVVNSINMEIQEGEFITLLGPSGCGKTTTLRMIAGFEKPTSGKLYFNNRDIGSLPPYKREINTVFQNYALFPHMTIAENIAFGLTIKHVSKANITREVSEMLDLVQLGGFGNRKPDQLSGGQKQRVAIARALVNHPKILLLDEPLGALDLKLRKQMQFELKRLQTHLGITFIYVTHDQEEALTMSDRIAVLSKGIVEQLGTPKEIYENPSSKFVADFIGESNIFDGTVHTVENGKIRIDIETGFVQGTDRGYQEGNIVDISIRPENIKLSKTPVSGFNCPGVIRECIYTGSAYKIIIALPDGKEVKQNIPAKNTLPTPGTPVFIYWDLSEAVVLPSPGNMVYEVVDNPVFPLEQEKEKNEK